MPSLYITEQGASLKKSGERLIVEKDGQVLLEVQCHKIESIFIFGNIQVTTQALAEILEHGIELSFLTQQGKLKGRLVPPESKNISLRMAQYEKANDREFCLKMAKIIVSGKLKNSIEVLRRFSYNHPDVELKQEIKTIEDSEERVKDAVTIQSILGFEGYGSKAYFTGFSKMCLKELKFTGRRKHPATDPINALLSFGYTLLLNEISAIVEGMGLDPYLGFYHQIEYGRQSLALDILEEFRQPVIDRFTLALTNKKVFTEEDFILDEESGSLHLKQESMKKYFRQYEEYMNQEFTHPVKMEKTNFRKCLRIQVEAMARVILSGSDYIPFYFSN